MKKPQRHAVKKDAGEALPGQRPLFPTELLKEMPLANRRAVPGSLVFKSTHAELHIGNLEEPIVWQLDVVRKAAEPAAIAKSFSPMGSRYVRTLKDIPAALLQQTQAAAPGATIGGMTELGLQGDDDHEYFLSKFGELCGVIRVQRKVDGSWKAGLAKTNLPRVLTKEAVSNGLMPPLGSSGLPKSLESVVPADYQFWKAQDASAALEMRNALVDSGFFDEASIQPVDGELRKVVTRHFLYDPAEDTKPAQAPTLSEAVAAAVPDGLMGKGFAPMSDGEDWLEKLDEGDAEGALAVLSPAIRTNKIAREMARSVKTLKGEYLLEHDDTRANRALFSGLGVVFKLASHPDRIFCSSFAPACAVQKLDDDVVLKTLKFQGMVIDIDRPRGYVQTGKDVDGNEWSREYLFDYGFFPGTAGGDGDGLDVFVGPNEASDRAFWVTQNKADGSFDEYKVFVGFDTAREARDAFAAHIPMKYYAGMSELPINTLKSLLGVEPEEMKKRLAKVAGISFDQIRSAVGCALDEKFPPKSDTASCGPIGSHYVDDLYDDAAIFYQDGKSYSIAYAFDPTTGKANLTGEPVAVVRTYKPIGGSPDDGAEPAPTGGELDQAQADKALQKAFDQHMARYLRIGKRGPVKKDDERYVLGVVLEPDVVDAQMDTYSPQEVRQAADKFMTDFRNMGLMHKGFVNEKVKILESYIAPTDFNLDGEKVKKGTWMMAVKVLDDGLWDQVKKGGLTGFSIGGSAIRKPVTQDV